MSFRIPSIKAIDYVIEANKIAWANVGRNPPCPCGKKNDKGEPVLFKFCHKPTLEYEECPFTDQSGLGVAPAHQ